MAQKHIFRSVVLIMNAFVEYQKDLMYKHHLKITRILKHYHQIYLHINPIQKTKGPNNERLKIIIMYLFSLICLFLNNKK